MKKRNSLIELYRFIFSMNVVKGHGYFPYQGPLFSPARISVEFFFTLSGWFLVDSIDKYRESTYWRGLFLLLRNKIASLGIPLFIGLAFGLAYRCTVGMEAWYDFSIWGYLWYVHDMLVVFIVYYTLRRIVKNERVFLCITAVIFLAASIIHVFPTFYSWGWFRAFSAMSLGVLISYLPRPKIKRQWLFVIPLLLAWAFALKCLLTEFSFIEEEILYLLAYPAIIYFTFLLPISSTLLDYLGSLSFGLYAYQSIPRYMEALGYENITLSFVIIVSLTVITDLLRRIMRSRKMRSHGTPKSAL